jgi:hypothetical protein
VLLQLNQNLYKWRNTSRVWCVNFHRRGGGVFIDANGTSTDLERSVWRQVEAGRPGGAASTDFAFSSSCRCVATKARAKPPQTLADRLRSWAGRPAPEPTHLGVWPTWSTCQIHPHGDDDFDILVNFTLSSLEMLQFST